LPTSRWTDVLADAVWVSQAVRSPTFQKCYETDVFYANRTASL